MIINHPTLPTAVIGVPVFRFTMAEAPRLASTFMVLITATPPDFSNVDLKRYLAHRSFKTLLLGGRLEYTDKSEDGESQR